MLKTQKALQYLFCLLVFALGVSAQTQKTFKNSNNPCETPSQETIDRKIDRVATCYRINPRLFRSLIWAESANKFKAVSFKGAACLTQLMPATARRFGLIVNQNIDERFNVDKCLNAGAKYLAWLLNLFKGDVRLALAGYNAGEGAVIKFGNRVPPYQETTQYVEKILFLFTGQRGHGVTAAYNQNLAYNWTNNLYRKRLVNPIADINRMNQSNSNDFSTDNLEEEIKAESSEVLSEKTADVKKTKITRVQVTEVKPKIKATASFYWKVLDEN